MVRGICHFEQDLALKMFTNTVDFYFFFSSLPHFFRTRSCIGGLCSNACRKRQNLGDRVPPHPVDDLFEQSRTFPSAPNSTGHG